MSPPHVLAEYALAAPGAAKERVVIIDDARTAHLRWAANEVTTNGSGYARRLTAIAVTDNAVGITAHIGDIDRQLAADVMRAAETAAGYGPPSDEVLPLPVAGRAEDWTVPPEVLDLADLAGFAKPLSAAFTDAGGRGRSLSGYAEQTVRTSYLATTGGTRHRYARRSGLVDITGQAGDATCWAGSDVRELADVDLPALTGELWLGLERARSRRELPPGRYEVLLPPSCVADLMLHLYEALDADDVLLGHNVFSGADGGARLGERLSGCPLTLRSDPAEPGLECAPFVIARSGGAGSLVDNGLPLAPTTWITDGRLTALVHNRNSAARAGQPVTPEIGNLTLSGPGGATLAEMVARTERGLLLTSLWYLRDVEPSRLLLTGVTRGGVYLVEDGQVVAAVNDFRFNESPVGLLGRVTETGRTEPTLAREWGDHAIRTAMPPLRVSDFAFSSTSPS